MATLQTIQLRTQVYSATAVANASAVDDDDGDNSSNDDMSVKALARVTTMATSILTKIATTATTMSGRKDDCGQ